MGFLSDLIAKNVKAYDIDAVVLGTKVMGYLQDELEKIGKSGVYLQVFGASVFSNNLIADNDIVFFKNGQEMWKIQNIQRHTVGLN